MSQAKQISDVTLAVLAGGAGRRMGMPKSRLTIRGRPILQFLLGSMQWPGPTLLATSPEFKNPPGVEAFDRQVVDPAAEGPLRGVLTALDKCGTPLLAVISVDMLMLRPAHLHWLLNELQTRSDSLGLMSKRSAGIEPLPLVCRKNAAAAVAAHWARGNRSLRSLTEIAGFAAIDAPADWPPQVWSNINTPEDYADFVQRLS
ncbi:MAG TPA: NTP transferase domain-containing protein [Tepidisphaeraceae bacterium]|nr:NTP transferase domain-containing protein [Tepidisphaeraceae bacterium]